MLNMPEQNTTTSLAKLAELHKNFEQAEREKLKEEVEKYAALYDGATDTDRRKILLAVAAVVALIMVGVGAYSLLQNFLRPSQLLAEYQEAKQAGRVQLATTTLGDYLAEVPDDWELIASHSYYLLEHGDFAGARSLYARLLNDSPLADDLEIQFASALSQLNTGSTRQKLSEIIVSLDKFIPALAARGLLETSDFSADPAADIEKAISEYEKLDKGGGTYKRYEQLLALFVVNSCRVPHGAYAGFLLPPYDSYPPIVDEGDLFIFGLDAQMPIDFCSVVPTNYENLPEFTPDLGSLLFAIKSFNEIRSEQRNEAIRFAVLSLNQGPIAMGSFLEGILLAEQGRFSEAEVSFLRTGFTTDPQMLINHGNVKILNQSNGWESASEQFEEAIKHDKDNPQAQNNLAVLSMLAERYGPAQALLETISKTSPSYLHGLYNLAVTEAQLGENENAIEKFFTFSGQGSYFPGVDYYTGKALLEAGLDDRALSSLKIAASTPSFNVFANLGLGDFYSDEPGAESIALDYYRAAYENDPLNYGAGFRTVLMQAKTGQTEDALSQLDLIETQFANLADANDRDYMKLFSATKGELYQIAEIEGAEELLSEAIKLAADDISLYKQIVLLYSDELIKNGKSREALDLTRTALPTDPNDVTLLLARARALVESNDLDQALQIVEQAAKADDSHPGVILTHARILAKDQRLEPALELYQQAYELNPIDTSPLEEALALLGQYDDQAEAIEELNLQIERAHFSTPSVIGIVGISQDRPAQAALSEEQIAKIEEDIKVIDELIETEQIEPFSAYIYRGSLLSKVGLINEAISDFLAATGFIDNASEGEAFQPYQRLTELYLRLGSYTDALESLNEGISHNPPENLLNSMILTRAGINEKIGKFDNAISDYSEIISLFPNHLPPYIRRCQLYLEKREADLAISDCTAAISIDPRNLAAYQARHTAYGILGDAAKASKDSRVISRLQNELDAESE